MSKILYIDAFSGISGDMLIGAFLDAGLPVEVLQNSFEKLKLPEKYQLIYKPVMKGAISAGYFKINLDLNESDQTHQQHRQMADIRQILKQSELSNSTKEKSLRMFELLAIAEGKVHGVEVEQVHFHEVGATDSILDIVGISTALDYFEINEVYSSSLPWCEGSVTTQHGTMPIPAPATLVLLRSCNATMRPFAAQVELITPTGAAFLAAFATFEKPAMTLEQQGSGAGTKDLPWPNILRVVIGESSFENRNEIIVMETNVDDMNPEWLGYFMDRCFALGALDISYEAIMMKKNRPATKISIIAKRQIESQLADLLLRETTTFGVRVYPVSRYEAERDRIEIQTEWGTVRVKRKWMDGKVYQITPEYEDCRQIAQEFNIPLIKIYDRVKNLINY